MAGHWIGMNSVRASDSILTKIFVFLFLAQIASLLFSIAVAQILYGLLFILCAVLMFRVQEYRATIFDIFVSVFIVIRLASIFLSRFPDASRIAYTREIIFYPYFFIASWYLQHTGEEGFRRAMQVFLVTSAVAAIIGVSKVTLGIEPRASSTTAGYVTLGAHLSLVFAMLLPFIFWPKEKKWLLGARILLVVVVVGTIFTYTRGAWLAIAIIFLVGAALASRKAAIASVVIVGALVLIVTPLRERVESLFHPVANDSGRLQLWGIGIGIAEQHPFLGYGPETFKELVPNRSILFDPGAGSWHNDFIQISVEGGIVGLIAAVSMYAIIILMLSAMRSNNRRSLSAKQYWYYVFFCLIAIFVDASLQGIMFSILNGFVLKFILASFSFILIKEHIFPTFTFSFQNTVIRFRSLLLG